MSTAIARRAEATVIGLKSLTAMVFGSRGGSFIWGDGGGLWLPNTRHDYAADIGDGRGSALVMSALNWIGRTFPEAPLRVRRRQADGMLQDVPDHPLTVLLERPNDAYSGLLLWNAILADWMLGNAYLLKVRSAAGRVVQVWWAPPWTMEPRWPDDGSVFISHYDYRPDGARAPIRVERADVTHFRRGLDPQNPRKGLSPLGSLLRELATDSESANFTASLLRNTGIPGVIISPAGDNPEPIDQPEAERVKTDFRQRFGGDNRGEPLVLSGKTDVKVLSFTPQQMDLKALRRVPEERVAAVLGIPASVLGFGAGMDRNTFSNAEQEDEKATERFLVPTWRLFAADIRHQLLPDFGDPKREVVDFDLSAVRALREDEDALHTRIRGDVGAGLLTVDEGRSALGLDALPDGAGDVLLIPATVIPTAPAALLPLPAALPPAALPPGGRQAPAGVSPTQGGNGSNGAGKGHIILANGALWSVDGNEHGVIDTKAADAPAPRDALEERLRADLSRYFERQAGRVLRRLDQLGDAPPTADALLPGSVEQRLLTRTLRAAYERALGEAEQAASDRLGRDVSIPDDAARALLDAVAERARGIIETSRDRIRDVFAQDVLDKPLEQTLIDLVANEARAATIAMSETVYGFNTASALAYQEAGVERVLISDGDQFDEACASVDGTEQDVSWWLENPSEHPNCVRSATAIVANEEGAAA